MAVRVLLGNPDGVAPDSMAAHILLGNSDGVDPDSLAARDISYPEFRAPTFYIRISHSRMGEEDVSTSPVKHIRILW